MQHCNMPLLWDQIMPLFAWATTASSVKSECYWHYGRSASKMANNLSREKNKGGNFYTPTVNKETFHRVLSQELEIASYIFMKTSKQWWMDQTPNIWFFGEHVKLKSFQTDIQTSHESMHLGVLLIRNSTGTHI